MGKFGEYDEIALKRVKDFTIQKYIEVISMATSPVLEIGPSVLEGAKNSAVFAENTKWFIDGRSEFQKQSKDYFTLDIDPTVSADFTGSIEDDVHAFVRRTFNSVVCFSVLEHCKNPFKVVENIHKILNPGGTAYFLTPWDLRFHGPRPDCWRISDDGYEALLSPSFSIELIEKFENPNRPLSPHALFVIATAR